MRDVEWTPGELRELEQLVERKTPPRQIALKLCRPVTSISGKIYRIRQRQQRERQSQVKTEGEKYHSYGHMVARIQTRASQAPDATDDRVVSRFEALPVPRGAVCIPLLELDDHHCRFPVRGGLYCGAPVDRKPYCRVHANICYTLQR